MSHQLALVGDPIRQSISPEMHAAAFAATGMDWSYQRLPIARGELASQWDQLKARFLGVNVTIPHKIEASRLVDRLTPAARFAGSVNTVTFSPQGSVGDSTDGPGFLAALDGHRHPEIHSALVVGTGGAARAVSAALSSREIQVLLVGRNLPAGERLAEELSLPGAGPISFAAYSRSVVEAALVEVQLLVNATPLGGAGWESAHPLPDGLDLNSSLTVFDLVYSPRRTRLLRRAASQGCSVIEGVEMLIEQAARSFEAWTGRDAPVAAMRAAAYLALDPTEVPAP